MHQCPNEKTLHTAVSGKTEHALAIVTPLDACITRKTDNNTLHVTLY